MAHPLVPLLILFIVVCIAAFIGYVVYTIANDISDKTQKKMEKHNVSFGKDGMKIGMKQVKDEDYKAQTQKWVAFAGMLAKSMVLTVRLLQRSCQHVESIELARVQESSLEQAGAGARYGQGFGIARFVGLCTSSQPRGGEGSDTSADST
jgi:hypothetical protein